MSDALEEMPLNARTLASGSTPNPWTAAAPFTPAPNTPALGDEIGGVQQKHEGEGPNREIQIVKVVEKGPPKANETEAAGPAHQKPTWAISKRGEPGLETW